MARNEENAYSRSVEQLSSKSYDMVTLASEVRLAKIARHLVQYVLNVRRSLFVELNPRRNAQGGRHLAGWE